MEQLDGESKAGKRIFAFELRRIDDARHDIHEFVGAGHAERRDEQDANHRRKIDYEKACFAPAS